MFPASELKRKIISLAAALTLCVGMFHSASLCAQVVGGSISGTISDNSGAVIPNASVLMKNVATGVSTAVESNSQGLYSAPNLLPGTYEQTVSATGFQTIVRTGIILTVGAQTILNNSMKVGMASEKVVVTEIAPDLQAESSTISSVIDSKTIVQLPLNGRSWTDLATLQPGVSTIRTMASVSSTDRLGRGLGVELSITGGRPQQNNYLLDGISINDYTNQAPGSILGGNLGADAIAEFNVLTTNYSTEYGRTSGGIISAITRSGTNQIHGSAYEFVRNSALDARNYFDTATIPPFTRNQFGASAGGPIRKDKTFIFGDYEGLRQSLGLSMVDNVPSAAARAGNLSTGTVTVDPQVLPFLGFYPLPNGQVSGDTGIYSFAGSAVTTENYFTTRLDNKFSDKDSLAGTYMYDNALSHQNDEFNNKLIFSQTKRQLVTLEEDHIFGSAVVNSFRLGYHRDYAASPSSSKALNPLAADLSLGFTPGDTAGFIGVPGLTFFSGGLSTQTPATFAWNSWQAYDNVFFTRGINSLKIGANVERIYDNQFVPSQAGGDFEFNSLSDFLTNNPFSLIADAPGGLSPRRVRETLFGTYFQDDIRLRRNLTVNAGLRYEIATVPTEINGKLAGLLHPTDPTVVLRKHLFANPSLRDFEPRVGFSYDPFSNGRNAIRAGFGMFDVQILPANLRHSLTGTVPFYASANGAGNLPQGSFPSQAFQLLSAAPNTERAAYIDPNPPRNYVMQWNLNIQHEISSNLTAMIAYVGSRGVHNLLQTDDSSIVLPIAHTPEGFLWPIPGTGTILNPNFGRVPFSIWASDSNYHALQVQVKQRTSHGLEGQISYTYGRSIDTSSGSTDGDQFLNGLSSLYFFSSKLRRGPSDFNQKHNVVLDYTWDIPGPQGHSALVNWVANGYELGGILQASSGTPFTTIISPDPLGVGNTDPLDFPDIIHHCNPIHGGLNYLNLNCFALPVATADIASQCQPFGFVAPGSGSPGSPGIPGTCANLLGNGGRNGLVGPGFADLDMSLFKNNRIKRISEQFNIQFRAEIFNILNHTNFNPPTSNNAIFDGGGNPVQFAGQLNATANTSRQIQFAVKVIF